MLVQYNLKPPRKRGTTHNRIVKQDTERIEIPRWRHRPIPNQQLRGNEFRSSRNLSMPRYGWFPNHPSHPKIQHLHPIRPPIPLRQQNILRLYISVNDASVVGVFYGVADLEEEGEGSLDGEIAGGAVLDGLVEGLAADKLHDQVGEAGGVVVAEIVEVDDVGVIDGAARLGLSEEAEKRPLVPQQFALEEFDGHLALEGFVNGAIDQTGGPGTDVFGQDEATRDGATEQLIATEPQFGLRRKALAGIAKLAPIGATIEHLGRIRPATLGTLANTLGGHRAQPCFPRICPKWDTLPIGTSCRESGALRRPFEAAHDPQEERHKTLVGSRVSLVIQEQAMKSLWKVCTGLVVLASLGIVLSQRFLPMNDAPSHIATAVIAQKLLSHDPFFVAHYRFDWVPVPYWTTTGFLLFFQTVLSPLTAWKLLIALYVGLFPFSLWVLWRSVVNSRRETEEGPLLMPLCAVSVFHFGYFMGESNYLLGQPFALLALALWIRSKKVVSLTFAGFVTLSVVSYFCHIYALAVWLAGASAWSCWALFAQKWGTGTQSVRLSRSHAVGFAWMCVLFAMAVYFVLHADGSDRNVGALGFDRSLYRLAHLFVDPFDMPSPPSRVFVAMLYAGLLGIYVVGHRELVSQFLRGQKRGVETLCELCEPGLLVPGLVLFFCAYLGPVAILAPDGSVKEGEIAIRFVLSGFVLAALSLKWPKLPSRPSNAACSWTRGMVLGLTMGFACLQLQSVFSLHKQTAQKTEDLSQTILSRIPPHHRVLPLLSMPRAVWTDYLLHRFGNYVVLRGSYSPHVFAAKGQQALRHVPQGDHREVSLLTVTPLEWERYDYVLLQTSEPLPKEWENRLSLDAEQNEWKLYRINRLSKNGKEHSAN